MVEAARVDRSLVQEGMFNRITVRRVPDFQKRKRKTDSTLALFVTERRLNQSPPARPARSTIIEGLG